MADTVLKRGETVRMTPNWIRKLWIDFERDNTSFELEYDGTENIN